MPTPHPLAAILTSAEGDPKLPDEDSRDRQFFLDLGGHAGRAHSSAAIRTARRQRYVVTDVHPGWSAPAGRLAVLSAGSPAWAFGLGLGGLGEGSRLAATGASRCIELSFQAGVLPLEPFDPPLQPFTLTLALFELALHARVLLRRRPGGVLLAARRTHTPFIGTCAILCTPAGDRRRLPRLAPRFDGCRSDRRGNQLLNHFTYLHSNNGSATGARQFFQVSTQLHEDDRDHWEDFRENNWVYTTERRSKKGWDHPPPDDVGRDYPLDKAQPGDVVLVRYKREGRGIGVVYSNDYRDRLAADSRLHVLWLNTSSTADLSGNTPIIAFSRAGETTIDAFRQAVEYTPTFDLLDRLDGKKPPPPPPPPPERHLEKLANALLIDYGHLRRVQRLLEDKRQVIFQGPPGTGKTYVARKLAACLAGGGKKRVRLVQFHPSYAYEDLVQGIRPTLVNGQPGFALRSGPLLAMAEQARREPDSQHFLVIDEINRGNLAKVFGELYFLLEYRDHEMQLQYSDEMFTLPDNLYVIGTMNTADRSIALVDLALRRRFHFVEFHPGKPPIQGLLRRWLQQNAPRMAWLADVVDRANDKLDDRQAAVGPSYFMRERLDEEMVRLIWEHNVLPYIEERLYGQHERLAGFELDALRRERQGAKTDDGSDDGQGSDHGDATS